LVCGALDALTPPDAMRAMAQAVAGATLVVIAGAGHLPNLEAPAAFGRALRAALARVDRP
jgi:pimeloyl-ACP methyl ester carboxylesterase